MHRDKASETRGMLIRLSRLVPNPVHYTEANSIEN